MTSYPPIFSKIIIPEKKICPQVFEILRSVNFKENEENALRLCGQRTLLQMRWRSPPKPTLDIISQVAETLDESGKLQFIGRTKQLMYNLTTEELSETFSTNEIITMLIGK